jgi:hypothetical protein
LQGLQGPVPVGGTKNADNLPVVPTAQDDEFDETTLNTTSKWTWRNQGTSTATLVNGSLVLTPQQGAGDNMRLIEQTVTGSWKYRTKLSVADGGRNYANAGIAVVDNTSGRIYVITVVDGSTQSYIQVNRMTNVTTYNNTQAQWIGLDAARKTGGAMQPVYLEVESNGTTLYFRASGDGIQFTTLYSEAIATWIGVADRIALFANDTSNNATIAKLVCDWFRKIEAGYDVTKSSGGIQGLQGVQGVQGLPGPIDPGLSYLDNYELHTAGKATEEVSVSSTAGSLTINPSLSNSYYFLVTEATTLDISSGLSGQVINVVVKQGATPYAVTFNASTCKVSGGFAITQTANAIDMFSARWCNALSLWLISGANEFS